MNALYDFFLTPQPKDSNKTRYHARLVVRDTITLEDIAETIESRSSLRQSDVIGSFIEFANVFKQELSNGNSIHIPGIGSFRIKAESPEVRSPKEIRAENIFAEQAVFPRLVDGHPQAVHGDGIFRADINVTLVGTDRIGGDRHSLDYGVGIPFQNGTIHKRAGITLVRVTANVFFLAFGRARKLPLAPRRKARAPSAA